MYLLCFFGIVSSQATGCPTESRGKKFVHQILLFYSYIWKIMSLTQTQAVGMDLEQPKFPQLIYVPIKWEDRQLNRYQLGTHG